MPLHALPRGDAATVDALLPFLERAPFVGFATGSKSATRTKRTRPALRGDVAADRGDVAESAPFVAGSGGNATGRFGLSAPRRSDGAFVAPGAGFALGTTTGGSAAAFARFSADGSGAPAVGDACRPAAACGGDGAAAVASEFTRTFFGEACGTVGTESDPELDRRGSATAGASTTGDAANAGSGAGGDSLTSGSATHAGCWGTRAASPLATTVGDGTPALAGLNMESDADGSPPRTLLPVLPSGNSVPPAGLRGSKCSNRSTAASSAASPSSPPPGDTTTPDGGPPSRRESIARGSSDAETPPSEGRCCGDAVSAEPSGPASSPPLSLSAAPPTYTTRGTAGVAAASSTSSAEGEAAVGASSSASGSGPYLFTSFAISFASLPRKRSSSAPTSPSLAGLCFAYSAVTRLWASAASAVSSSTVEAGCSAAYASSSVGAASAVVSSTAGGTSVPAAGGVSSHAGSGPYLRTSASMSISSLPAYFAIVASNSGSFSGLCRRHIVLRSASLVFVRRSKKRRNV